MYAPSHAFRRKKSSHSPEYAAAKGTKWRSHAFRRKKRPQSVRNWHLQRISLHRNQEKDYDYRGNASHRARRARGPDRPGREPRHSAPDGRQPGANEVERKAGLLHDIVEDTAITPEDLLSKGVEKEVVEAVDLLTHRDGDSYEDYVRKIVRSRNHTAIQVKLNDRHHNLARAKNAMRMRQATSRINDEDFVLILDALKKHIWAEKFIRQHQYLPLTA